MSTSPVTKRFPVGAGVLLAAAAALMWIASRMTWVRVTSADGLGPQRHDALDGATWFAALTPLALVLVAAIAALLAVRGLVSRLLGVVVSVIGVLVAVPPVALLTGHAATVARGAQLADLPGRAHVTGATYEALPAVVAVIAACCAFAAGLLLARRPPKNAGLSARYANPTTRRADAARRTSAGTADADSVSERVLWDALDAGEDPTKDGGKDHDGDDRDGR